MNHILPGIGLASPKIEQREQITFWTLANAWVPCSNNHVIGSLTTLSLSSMYTTFLSRLPIRYISHTWFYISSFYACHTYHAIPYLRAYLLLLYFFASFFLWTLHAMNARLYIHKHPHKHQTVYMYTKCLRIHCIHVYTLSVYTLCTHIHCIHV